MKAVLALIGAALSFCILADAGAQDASPTLTQPMIDLRSDCLRQFAQPKFAAIHDKVPYLAHSTELMILLGIKPSTSERAALREFLPVAMECSRKSFALLEPPQAPIMDLYQLSESATVGGLALLAAGQITYSDYAMIVDLDLAQDEAFAKVIAQQEAAQQQVSQQQAEQQAVITLSCIIHMDAANELSAAMNGVEYQYSIDPVHKTATASKGPGPPTNVDVSPSLIRFRQGDLYVSISRATGRFSQQLKDNPYAILGTCEPIHGAKF